MKRSHAVPSSLIYNEAQQDPGLSHINMGKVHHRLYFVAQLPMYSYNYSENFINV